MMNKLLLIGIVFFTISSCTKNKSSETDVVPQGVTKYSGSLSGRNGYTASGAAKILLNGSSYSLSFNSFSSSGGPDLKVYLSKRDTPFEFINLGALKSTSGNQSYDIPAGVDFTVHKYVLIHCQQFNKLFAVAELVP